MGTRRWPGFASREHGKKSMSSGVLCADECITAFNAMKLRQESKYIIFKISDDKKSIIIESKGDKSASFEDFTKSLEDNTCRYCMLDVEIETKSGATTNKLVFVSWSDDNAPVKQKMLYASSKDAIKKSFDGIAKEYQATDRGELNYEAIQKKAAE